MNRSVLEVKTWMNIIWFAKSCVSLLNLILGVRPCVLISNPRKQHPRLNRPIISRRKVNRNLLGN